MDEKEAAHSNTNNSALVKGHCILSRVSQSGAKDGVVNNVRKLTVPIIKYTSLLEKE